MTAETENPVNLVPDPLVFEKSPMSVERAKRRSTTRTQPPAVAKGADHYKYNEGEILDEIRATIDGTYQKHYSGEDNVQALDAIIASGNGEGFTIGNVQKYAFRYGKKGGYNRDDLLKVVHYAVVALHLNTRYAAQRQPAKKK